MISACTRYVPGGTPVIVYRPAESVRASNRVPATVMRASHSGAPVSCARTTPAIAPVSWARAIWGGNSTDRKSTRLNSSHDQISYAVFCLKKKKKKNKREENHKKNQHETD